MDKKIKRPRLTTAQTKLLSIVYQQNPRPSNDLRCKLASDFNIPIRTVQIWFQNRRAKDRKYNTLVSSSESELSEKAPNKAASASTYDEYYRLFIEENYK
ncbi:hypothetical protein NEPAR06_0087 [Nematocida parisii]|uniref:Homeobox domain-containing protein n=1 Tax=Nematocida parisii (strain ERTm3) TaxID=935791 RepID=I3EE59_NEMP3|nr:uncharacterized protein NEPG_00110 [Nematocida parisii ERTm1]EIJ87506.1 hypothetical protein NEQG_02387 [Nematocida parisii ERTm3]KAI5130079.1 hypothetical protein NEPAR08_1845 [Nematocida parisii]EIJ94588.1 hypothetical protein NEPG_00110 [Nematocida parisii ERTm1]KAI5130476.1 hypothetical protein NEPAR03_2094 [Nematocida parisii]KAI5142777.1 hypothetical protein NEPAR07_0303 [Nematocida parisii]|eukprot:XP_013057944.1 hypothetical protein NEPG_00110 [Nematocida parisii ERTm1]